MKIIICLLMSFLGLTTVEAQSKIKETTPKTVPVTIKMEDKTVSVKGSLINSFSWRFDNKDQASKYDYYYFRDSLEKIIILTEVYYEIDKIVVETKSIKTYTIPFIKLNKKGSYILDMDDEYTEGGKYYRLTILNEGANQAYIKQEVIQAAENSNAVSMVGYVTIPFQNKTIAEKYLKEFTK